MEIGNKLKVITLTAGFALAGCAAPGPSAPTFVSFDLGVEKNFTYKNVDAEGVKIQAPTIVNLLADSISKSSSYDSRRETGTGVRGLTNVFGTEIKQTPNAFYLSYVNGDHNYDTRDILLTRSTAIFQYNVIENADTISIKVFPPKQLETVIQSNTLRIPFRPLDSEQRLAADTQRIFINLNPVVQRFKGFNGDFDAGYGVDSIVANFKRKCEKYTTEERFSKLETTCNLGGVSVRLNIDPYKNGSKVTYRFAVPYALTSDGNSTYSADLPIQVIAKIERIVKD